MTDKTATATATAVKPAPQPMFPPQNVANRREHQYVSGQEREKRLQLHNFIGKYQQTVDLLSNLN